MLTVEDSCFVDHVIRVEEPASLSGEVHKKVRIEPVQVTPDDILSTPALEALPDASSVVGDDWIERTTPDARVGFDHAQKGRTITRPDKER
jgi:hypothetical protein